MTVRKKVSTTNTNSDKMNLSPELERVRREILQLPTEEIAMNPEAAAAPAAAAGGTTAAGSTVKKKATTSVKKKAPAKKTSSVKKKTPTKKVDADMVKLADIAKTLRMEPTTARRVLRAAEIERGDGQWAWKKGSPSHEKVLRILRESKAE